MTTMSGAPGGEAVCAGHHGVYSRNVRPMVPRNPAAGSPDAGPASSPCCGLLTSRSIHGNGRVAHDLLPPRDVVGEELAERRNAGGPGCVDAHRFELAHDV